MSVCLTRKSESARVNLTKPVIREYTPEHIAYEPDPPKPLPSYTPEHVRSEVMPAEKANKVKEEAKEESIKISVVKVENAPTVIDTNLDICMDTILDSLDSADVNTEKAVKNFYKQLRHKRWQLSLRNWRSRWENRRHLGDCGRDCLISLGLGALTLVLGFVVIPWLCGSLVSLYEGTADAEAMASNMSGLIYLAQRLSLLSSFVSSLASVFCFIRGIQEHDLLD